MKTTPAGPVNLREFFQPEVFPMNKRLIAAAAVICAAVLVIAGVIAAAHHKKTVPQQGQSTADSVRDASETDPETEAAETDAKGKKTGKASADKTTSEKKGDPSDETVPEEADVPNAESGDPDKAQELPGDDLTDSHKKEPPTGGTAPMIPDEEPEQKQETVVPYVAPTPPGKVSHTKTEPEPYEPDEDPVPQSGPGNDDDDKPLPEISPYDPGDHADELPEVFFDEPFETEED